MWTLITAIALALVGSFTWSAYRAAKRPSYWEDRSREEITSIRAGQGAAKSGYRGAQARHGSPSNTYGGGAW